MKVLLSFSSILELLSWVWKYRHLFPPGMLKRQKSRVHSVIVVLMKLLKATNADTDRNLLHLWGLLPLSYASLYALASFLQEDSQDPSRIRCTFWHCCWIRTSHRDDDSGFRHRRWTTDLSCLRKMGFQNGSWMGSALGYHAFVDRPASFPGYRCPFWLRLPLVTPQLGAVLGGCRTSRLSSSSFHRQLRILFPLVGLYLWYRRQIPGLPQTPKRRALEGQDELKSLFWLCFPFLLFYFLTSSNNLLL